MLDGPTATGVASLQELADAPVFTVFQRVAGSPRGLTEAEAEERLLRFGENEPPRVAEISPAERVGAALRSPFVALLAGLGAVLVLVSDARGAAIVAVMIVLAVTLRFWQQTRSIRATRALREMVTSTVTVRRRAGADELPMDREVPLQDVVPGDVVVLQAGDIVPADLRIVAASELVVDQTVLTGESLPAAKSAEVSGTGKSVVGTPNVCLSGTAVVSGRAKAVVIATGAHTYFGALAGTADASRPESSFDRGVRAVGWTLVRFMLVMAPIVFVVNGLVRGSWGQAAMFALAVAVGLTPEMLPVIVTSSLARGAVRLARERVIVNRLNAIQDLGAIDVLCVDKTGTLTEDRIVYVHSTDVTGRIDQAVDEFAYLAVHFGDGPQSRLDDAIAALLAEPDMCVVADAAFAKVDEIAFDYARRRSTVVVSRQRGEHIMICKGDPEQVLPRCSRARLGSDVAIFSDDLEAEARELLNAYRTQGMRVLAVAVKSGPARFGRYHESDENDLVLAGFVAFVDPIRDSASTAVRSLAEHGVGVKILSGDSKTVAEQVATQVGVCGETILGEGIDRLSPAELREIAARTGVFAELTPAHKTQIVTALRDAGNAVGFLGDGVNDVPALRVADAGIAADTATDVAKHAADLILLDKDLAVVARGVVEGRRTLANTMKYVRITASSNLGNVLSVLAASAFLPFLPILPIQLLVQNLLYDTAQLTLPWDRVDSDYLKSPRRWKSHGLVPFMVTFGALSSAFDVATFAALWWIFDVGHSPRVFQTGWFVEGLITQLLVVLVLRGRAAPWRGARAASVVVAAAVVVACIGLLLPITPAAHLFQMAPASATYLLWLLAVAATYGLAAHVVKRLRLRYTQSWL
jgi:Mg2+-importing ATPase